MDIIRVRRRAPLSRIAMPIAAIAFIAAAGYSLSGLLHPHQAEPAVARENIVTDVVRSGAFAQSVRASGKLASERVFVVSAVTDGIVASLPIRPGTAVTARTIVATMTNPDLETVAVSAAAEVRAAQAQAASVREQANGTHLDMVAARTAATAQAGEDADQAAVDQQLNAAGYLSDLIDREAAIKAAASRSLVGIAAEKIAIDAAQSRAKIAEAGARVEQLAGQLAASRQRLATLQVRAGAPGVVQAVATETGARLTAGMQIAQVADQRDLKAVLDVPETEVHAVAVGMPASIDVQGRSLSGRVVRIDPAAQNGSVAVDVLPDRGFPDGARPEGSVDGTIRLSAVRNALSMARPASAVDGQSADIYRVEDGGTRAVRTHVTFGVGSDDRITIVAGLAAGQTVIISDMSAANGAAAVRLQ
jgi:HlyD family secretion protein